MAIVSDSSPLIALERIQQLQLLPQLFSQIVIPTAVQKEFAQSFKLPDWLIVQSVSQPPSLGAFELSLGAGEREAISLSLEIEATWFVVDDKAARTLARSLHLPIIGTLGILLAAKRRGLLAAVRPHVDALERASFYLAPELHEHVLAEAREG